MVRTRLFAALAAGMLAAAALGAGATAAPAAEPAGGTDGPAHAMAMHGEPKYGPGFAHFDYVDPDAPKGGETVQSVIDTFDSLNPFIIHGNPAGGALLIYDTLTTSSADEAFTQYCLVCETMEIPDDRSWVEYTLREDARWHDGKPITPDDVIFSFDVLREKGAPHYRFYYADVKSVEKTGPRKVKFDFGGATNPELPLILGQLPVLPKHYWESRDFGRTTLEPPLGSGPYRIGEVKTGRSIVLERVEDYWAADHPVNVGRNNFDRYRFEYFRDPTVAREAFKAGNIDRWIESSSKAWATEFADARAVREGMIVKREFEHHRTTPMQGFVFNLRKPMFQDPRVRQALTLAFDFEWSNENLFYGAYTRTDSYFDNSELGSQGPLAEAGEEEREILDRYRDKLPEEVYTQVYEPPSTGGTQQGLRRNLREAAGLLEEAGWTIDGGKRVDAETDQPLRFEILLDSPAFERIALPYVRNLERLGVTATVRLVDTAQYRRRSDSFDFDMVVGIWGQSESPGNEQRDFWGSRAAEDPGSRNLIGISNPVIDELIELVVQAGSRDSLVQRTRALDRALLWGHYLVPHWHSRIDRVAYWNRFGMPETIPRQGVQLDTWWVEPDKAETVSAYRGR